MTATKKQLAAWAGLKNRRERLEAGCFLAEGRKVVDEVLAAGWPVEALLRLDSAVPRPDEYALSREQMERVSGFRTAPDVLAIVRLPPPPALKWTPGTLAFLLDGVQDPGNVGTILRTAAWFGFDTVFCGPTCADPWHPKVIQASMGAFLRVHCPVVDPIELVQGLAPGTPVLGTFLSGQNLFAADLPSEGLIVLGNEGHGIGDALAGLVTLRLTIPRFGTAGDSLNVAAATALLGAEFRRRMV